MILTGMSELVQYEMYSSCVFRILSWIPWLDPIILRFFIWKALYKTTQYKKMCNIIYQNEKRYNHATKN